MIKLKVKIKLLYGKESVYLSDGIEYIKDVRNFNGYVQISFCKNGETKISRTEYINERAIVGFTVFEQ